MTDQFSRTELLIGKEKLEKIKKSKVAVFGIGGVGSFVVEGLARAGVESFILVDKDKVDLSNLNRQIISLQYNIGDDKTRAWEKRIKDINPLCEVIVINEFIKIVLILTSKSCMIIAISGNIE